MVEVLLLLLLFFKAGSRSLELELWVIASVVKKRVFYFLVFYFNKIPFFMKKNDLFFILRQH